MDGLLARIGGGCDLSFSVDRPVKRENYKYLAA
jgi:hypothetical protein